MAKHKSFYNEFLDRVYSVVRHLDVDPIDGRTMNDIKFNSDVVTTTAILNALVAEFGEPTSSDPMLAEFTWRIGKNVIVLPKAAQMKGRGLINRLSAW